MRVIGRTGHAMAVAIVVSALTGTSTRAAETYIGLLLLESVGVQQTPGGAAGHRADYGGTWCFTSAAAARNRNAFHKGPWT